MTYMINTVIVKVNKEVNQNQKENKEAHVI